MTTVKTCTLPTLLLFFTAPLFAQWTEITPNVGLSYWPMCAISDDTALVIGLSEYSEKSIFGTVDGGRHWQKRILPSGYNTPVYQIQFLECKSYSDCLLSLRRDYLPGLTAVLLHTADSGVNWEEVTPPYTGAPAKTDKSFTDIRFADAEHGVLFSDVYPGSTRIRTTDDGGKSWTERQLVTEVLHSPQLFPDGSGHASAYIAGNLIFWATDDYGYTWNKLSDTEVNGNWPRYRQHVWFLDEYYASEDFGYRTKDGTLYAPFIFNKTIESTLDGGLTWKKEPIELFEAYYYRLQVKQNTTWLMVYNQVYRHPNTNTVSDDHQAGVLEIRPNPVVPGELVLIKEPRKTTGFAEIKMIEPATGREVYREILKSGDGRALFRAPALRPGVYIVEFFFVNQLRATGKLLIR